MIEDLSKRLLTKSYNNLELKLNSYGVSPSKESLNCLYGLLKVFSKALDKTLEDAHYICSVDPGGGKTEAIVCFVQAWKSLGFLPKGGILIAVNTKDQIHSLVNRLGLDKDDYACLAGDDTILRYGLGQSSIDDAKVLITTQQMIVSRTSGKAFSDAADFFYKGKPRSLRVWDESLIPSEPISIKISALFGLSDKLDAVDDLFADSVAKFAHSLRVKDVGEQFAIPSSFAKAARSIYAKAELPHPSAAAETIANYRGTLDALIKGAGRPFRLGNYGGESRLTLVGSSKPLPSDLNAIVLDASARVRKTYDMWSKSRASIVMLPSTTNNYKRLNIHLWNTPCGNDVLRDRDKSRTITSEVTRIIASKPDEDWLVIGKKRTKSGDIDLKAWINDGLPEEVKAKGRVRYLHWGRHTAVNDYKDIKNVIVIGTHQYGPAGYDALAAAVQGSCEKGLATSNMKAMRESEYANHLLQALMRSNARNARSGTCGDCNAYIVASNWVTEAMLLNVFPGAKVGIWRRDKPALTGHAMKLVDYLSSIAAKGHCAFASKADVRKAIGLGTTAFTKLIRNKAVQYHMSKMGITCETRKFIFPSVS